MHKDEDTTVGKSYETGKDTQDNSGDTNRHSNPRTTVEFQRKDP